MFFLVIFKTMKKKAIHLIFWALYVLFKTYLNQGAIFFPEMKSFSEEERFLYILMAQCIYLLLKIPLVYGVIFIIEKYFKQTLNGFKTVIIIAFCFLLASLLFSLLNPYFILPTIFNFPSHFEIHFSFESLAYNFFVLAFVVGAALVFKLIEWQYQSRLNEELLKTEKIKTELLFLKAQTNPHFLFNTLNNIYALARKNSDKTADSVLKLSKLLHFMLYESGKKNIAITDEVKLMEDYVSLEKLRYGHRLNLNFETKIDNPLENITPLLLIPLVENAFKHGASEARNEIKIDILLELNNGQLTFKVINSIEETNEITLIENIGLKNLKRQLELLYPNSELILTKESQKFSAILKIQLRAYATN